MPLILNLSTGCQGYFVSFRYMVWSCWDVLVVGYRLWVGGCGLPLLPASWWGGRCSVVTLLAVVGSTPCSSPGVAE